MGSADSDQGIRKWLSAFIGCESNTIDLAEEHKRYFGRGPQIFQGGIKRCSLARACASHTDNRCLPKNSLTVARHPTEILSKLRKKTYALRDLNRTRIERQCRMSVNLYGEQQSITERIGHENTPFPIIVSDSFHKLYSDTVRKNPLLKENVFKSRARVSVVTLNPDDYLRREAP
jgi:hypothetical protein